MNMAMAATLPESSTGRWISAALIAVAALGMASSTLGNILAGRAPQAAVRVSPGNADALATLAAQAATPGPDGRPAPDALDLARRAFRRDPTEQRALRSIGFVAELNGNQAVARRMIERATRISARDLEAQLWLIEDAVRRDDVQGALTHHDIALRVSKRAPPLLFPVLIAATEDRALLAPLVRVLSRKPAWGNFFLLNAAGGASRPDHVAWVVERLIERRIPVSGEAVSTLIARLADSGRYTAAWRLYAASRPRRSGGPLRDPTFVLSAGEGTPFDWRFIQDGALAGPDSDGERSFLGFSAPVGVGGVVASQTTIVPAGRYRLSTEVLASTAPNGAAPAWQVKCADDNQQLARLPILQVEDGERSLGADFIVPERCEAIVVELVVEAVDTPGGQEGRIASVGLTPRSGRGR